MYQQNQEITDKYLNKIVPLFPYPERHKKMSNIKTILPCPFCFAKKSKDWERKNRCAALFHDKEKSTYNFNCRRCGKKCDFSSLLMDFSPVLQKRYHREMELNGLTGKNCNLKKLKPRFDSPKNKFNQNKKGEN